MADTIPAKLKQPDIVRFVHRANQLRQAKPAITYWCEYWVLNQILQQQLHKSDDDCLVFTTTMMDRLERLKKDHAEDDAIVDSTAGQAFVEQFAQETFDRAERVLKANRVTRQTADTFDAAATFFQLTQIWAKPDEEMQKKIVYAKWNAARILKAIKDGKDPNESNPKQAVEEELPPLDPNDPDVRQLAGSPAPGSIPSPRLTDTPDPNASTPGNVPLPTYPRQPLVPGIDQQPSPPGFHAQATPDRHPTPQGYYAGSEPAPPSPLSQHSADGLPGPGGHRPIVPHSPYSHPPVPQQPPTNLPPHMSPAADPRGGEGTPPRVSPDPQTQSIWTAPGTLPPHIPPKMSPPAAGQPMAGPPPMWDVRHVPGHGIPPQNLPTTSLPPQGYGVSHLQSPPQRPTPDPWHPASPPQEMPRPSEVDILKAQKHAKWSISALNFEDVPTAIKELRTALAALGAGPG